MTVIHHAALVRADSVMDLVVNDIDSLQTEVGDFYTESFGIDDARELIRKAYQKPNSKSEQLLIVRAEFITHEAQNSLLKLLEEPPSSTRLVFVLPPDFILLSTLNSRLHLQENSQSIENQVEPTFAEFARLDYKDRIEAIDQAVKQKNTAWQRLIKKGLIKYLKQNKVTSIQELETEYVARTLLTRGASNKMLLEHLALVLPTRLKL